MEKVFEKIRNEAEESLARGSHNFEHVERVYNLCMRLAEEIEEEADLEVLKAAAWLHDIARHEEDEDSSGKTDHALTGTEKAGKILREVGFPEKKIKKVQECICTHRFRADRQPESTEAKILFDADKLDAVGAVGVARGILWYAENNANPIKIEKRNAEEYAKENLCGKTNGRIQDKKKHSMQIEFETKLRHLPSKMHFQKTKELAEERAGFYKQFIERMEKEINGKK